ncbi:MAG: tetratricopeptide repeat protein [Planctomycetota bacterium]
MQRYRVNLPLLIGLVVGSVVLAGGSYGLYTFQKARNANRLLDQEQEARAEGDLKRSVKLLADYLRIRPGDEEAMTRLSVTLADIAEQPTSEPVDIRNAIGQLEATVRDYPERDDLRRRLVDVYMSRRVRMLKPAVDHVSQLLNRKPKDPELEVMLSECYFAAANPKALPHAFDLIGYDESSDEFNESEAVAPNDPGVYSRAARTVRADRSDDRLADRIIEQMVKANPDDGMAYLTRGQYIETFGEKDDAIPDIRKALEIDPDNSLVIMSNARLLARDEKYDEAKALLEEGIEKHPAEPGLYQTLADVIIRQGDYDAALACCDRGIAAVPAEQSQMLTLQKARLQLQQNDLAATRSTIKEMRESELFPSAYPDYLEARVLMADSKWLQAARTFEKYQTFMANIPSLGVELNVMLGLCREKLGQEELAMEAFRQALRLEPDNTMADLGLARMRARRGVKGSETENVSIYSALAIELNKPEDEQDWKAFDERCEAYIERMKLPKAMLEVLRGEVFMRRKMYIQARKALVKSYEMEPDNLGVRRAAVKLFAADPEKGPVQALKLLDKVVADFGDLPILRLERADLLTVINDEDLTDQLFALTDGLDDWTDPQKVQLYRGLAQKFGRLRNEEARSECLRKVAELSPSDLPTLLELFAVAMASNDKQAMQDAQKRLLDVVGSKEDPTWQYTEAQRLLTEFRAAGGEGDQINQARDLVERAIAQRGDWHKLHNLKADIALAQGKVKAALASYDKASELGRQDARELFQYIKLLTSRGRFADALEQMEQIKEDGRLRLLGRDYAESLLRVGRNAEAVVAAQSYAEQAPNNSAVQLWLGRFLSQASGNPNIAESRKEELIASAGEAFTKAIETNNKSPEAWLALVGYFAATGKSVEADDAIREAQLALPEDGNQLLFARCYEMVGRGLDAEALYRQAYDEADDSEQARVSRLLSQFYLSPAYRRPDAVEKATPLINGILKDAAEGTIPADDANARWARTTAARLLALKGGYQQLRDAERLIASNSRDGVLPTEDRLLMAEILAPRPEPVSRLKAVNLLEEIGQNQRLSKKSDLELGRLYFALGKWRQCREQMLDVIGRYPDDPNVRVQYIEMLLQRGGSTEVDRAVRQVQRLREMAPNDLATREMLARVAYEKGKKNEGAKALLSMLPRDASKITDKQLPLVRRIGSRLVEFEDYERARKVYELAAKVGGVPDQLMMAQFIGQHLDADEGLDRIESLRGDADVPEMVQAGLVILRKLESSGGDVSAAAKRVEEWLERGLREDPDLVSLRMQRAELHDILLEYEKAADAYRSLLARDDLRGVGRAVVLNNLAYLLALSQDDKASISEADKYISEAVDLLGPGTEILDTRAVIALADERYDDAIADLELALIDKPTAAKYFHLATAYADTGRIEDAKEAWGEAVDRGLSRETVSRLERETFDQTKQKLEAGGLTSVTR